MGYIVMALHCLVISKLGEGQFYKVEYSLTEKLLEGKKTIQK